MREADALLRQQREFAGVIDRLGALVEAGLSADQAWRALAAAPGVRGGGPAGSVTRLVAAAASELDRGCLTAEALRRAEAAQTRGRMATERREVERDLRRVGWFALVHILDVIDRQGGSLASGLAALGRGVRARIHTGESVRATATGPRMTVNLLIALPGLGLVVAGLLGIGAWEALVSTPPGWASLGVGLVLNGLGVRWSRSLLRRAGRTGPDEGLFLETFAVFLDAGMPPNLAREEAAAVARATADDPSEGSPVDGAVDAVWLSERTGAPLSRLLISLARQARTRQEDEIRESYARLEQRLLLPIGLCLLPSFMALAVIPVGLALAPAFGVAG